VTSSDSYEDGGEVAGEAVDLTMSPQGGESWADSLSSDIGTSDVFSQDTEEFQLADVEEADVVGDAFSGLDFGAQPAPEYPLDDTLRLNHLQAKGTHNSYHIQPSDWTLAEWSYTHAPLAEQLELQGVRQLELDVHYEGEDGFTVFHLPVLDEQSTCHYFKDCLGEVKAWSDARPGHHPIFILVEPKDEFDVAKINGHYAELDAEILSVFPEERVILPDDVRGDYPTLREALEAEGWPTLGASRNKVLFVMLDSDSHRDRYLQLHPDLHGAVIFARGGYGESYGAVLEYGSGEEMAQAVEEGYLLRGNADDLDNSDEENQEMAAAALSKGAHFISTDFADSTVDAFSFSIPGGQPSRCNPLTAPPECSAADIEAVTP